MIPKKKKRRKEENSDTYLSNNSYNQCHDELSKDIIERLKEIINYTDCRYSAERMINDLIHDIEEAGKGE